MTIQAQHGALMESFSTAGVANAETFDMDAYDNVREYMRGLSEEGDKRAIQVQMDMGTAEQLGGGLRGLNATTATKQKEAREKKNRERDIANRHLQALLDQINALGEQIDDLQNQIDVKQRQIEKLNLTISTLNDGSLDPESALEESEVKNAVRAWEERTGRKYDANADNASDILVAILAGRVDELGNEIAILETKKNILETQRTDLLQQADAIQTSIDSNAPKEVIDAQISHAIQTVEGARIIAMELQENSEIVGVARESHDGFRDDKAEAEGSVNQNETDFGALGGLLDMKGTAVEEFQTATNNPSTANPLPETEINPSPGFSGMS